MDKLQQRDYFWGMTLKQGTNLNFLLAEDAKDGNYVAVILHKVKKTAIWGEGATEVDAFSELKQKVEKRFGEIEGWKIRMFDVCVFDESGNSKDIAPGHVGWTLIGGYLPGDRKLK